jgi:Ca-activated chloride channel family protein
MRSLPQWAEAMMRAVGLARPLVLTALLVLGPAVSQGLAQAKRAADGPALSASRQSMAGAPLSVGVSRAPVGARLAIARPDNPAERAIVVVPLGPRSTASLPMPGLAGRYELRLTADRDGAPVILLRQPLAATEPNATVAAPGRVRRGASFAARGIGPNGERDRVVLVAPASPPEATGPHFYPFENVEATLEAPDQPGAYELRYVMDAPLSGPTVLARTPVTVE